MAIQIGGDTRLQVDTAASEGSPTWVDIGFETSSGINIAPDTVSADTKGNNGWGTQISILNRFTISCEIQADRSDTSLAYLETNAFARTRTHFRWNITNSTPAGGDGTMTGWGYISGYDMAAEIAGTVTVSITVEGDGELVVA
jgi:hypothetical protein